MTNNCIKHINDKNVVISTRLKKLKTLTQKIGLSKIMKKSLKNNLKKFSHTNKQLSRIANS